MLNCFRNRLERERERDISEQIALGMPAKTISGGETQFDSRLFNQSKGMDSGFADEDAYNVYDKYVQQCISTISIFDFFNLCLAILNFRINYFQAVETRK